MDAFIVGGLRTAIGRFQGTLASIGAVDLGATVVRKLVATSGLPTAKIDEVIFGNVLQGGLGQNPARQVAMHAGLPNTVPSFTVNKVCGSGLKAIELAAQLIRLGEAEVVIAGGIESMSRAPFFLPGVRKGQRLGHGEMLDSVIHDALWDRFCDCHMGITAENIAERYGITRAEQDEFALGSQRKANDAVRQDLFSSQIVPVELPGKNDVFIADEHLYPETTMESLASLRTVFKSGGTVTAGNSSGINDGAAAVLIVSERVRQELEPAWAFRIRGTASAGVPPEIMGCGPIPACKTVLGKTGMEVTDLDLVEVNEAFAAQSIQVHREMGWEMARVNVLGGAIALGHPVGASGTRIMVTLLHELVRRGKSTGLASLCIGGGQGIAMTVERI